MTPLLGLDAAGLDRFFAELGEKPFRARQVSRWLHQRFADAPQRMTDLAKVTRERLAAAATIAAPAVIRDTTASDGTRKWLFDESRRVRGWSCWPPSHSSGQPS